MSSLSVWKDFILLYSVLGWKSLDAAALRGWRNFHIEKGERLLSNMDKDENINFSWGNLYFICTSYHVGASRVCVCVMLCMIFPVCYRMLWSPVTQWHQITFKYFHLVDNAAEFFTCNRVFLLILLQHKMWFHWTQSCGTCWQNECVHLMM